jgi:carbon monoxide dehydrogenase subunit G
MKLEQSFEVAAPVQTVWEALIDVERVAPCLPGAEITQANADGSYEGTFQVRLGPTTAAYAGKLAMESLDESARRATMKASGRDKRGQGSANATIVSAMSEVAEGTRVEVETDFTITGRLARFGRGGMMQDISNRLLGDFADCLRQSLEGGGAAAGAGEDQPSEATREATTPASAGAEPGVAVTSGRPPTQSPGPAEAATGRPQPSSAPGAGAGYAPPSPPTRRAPAQPAKPVKGLSLFLLVLLERIKRLLARLRSR